MIWNISYTLPTFFFLLILFVYYVVRPKLNLRTNKFFLALLLTDGLTTIVDYVATLADSNYAHYQTAILYLLNGTFFLLFFFA